MCQQLDPDYPLSYHIMIIHFKPYDLDPSLDRILHQPLRCILSSDQEKHQKPITCIFYFDLTLHMIFITCKHSPLIFSFLYTQILFQYFEPKPQLCCQYSLMVSRFFAVLIIITQYHGRNPWYSLSFIFHPIRAFSSLKVHAYVYAHFILLTCVYTLLGQSEPVYTS